LRVFVTTWNCGDVELSSLENQSWLKDSLTADIVAIGMQESKLSHAFQMISEFYRVKQPGLQLLETVSMWHVGLGFYHRSEL